MYFKHAVDALGTGPGAGVAGTGAAAAVSALLMSGACRVVSGITKEAQLPVFTPVAQVSRFAGTSGRCELVIGPSHASWPGSD